MGEEDREWQLKYMEDNLSDIIANIDCNVSFLSQLRFLTAYERERVQSRSTRSERADELLRIARQRLAAYEEIARALHQTKQTVALDILLRGYDQNGVPRPASLPSAVQSGTPRGETRKPFEELIIGDPDCSKIRVGQAIISSQSFASFESHWSMIALYLGIPEARINDMKRMRMFGTHSLADLVMELLTQYRAKAGANASLDNLCRVLHLNGCTDIAETLEKEFGKSVTN